jgi:predicted amidohydrolase YtcJ
MRVNGIAAGRVALAGCAALLCIIAACSRQGQQSKPAAATASPELAADVVFRGGVVYTLDAARSTAEAAAVRGGRIVAVGGAAEIGKLVGPQTEVVELNGGMLLPGFHDAHVHPVSAGIEELGCGLYDAQTVEEVLAKVRSCAEQGSGWLVGGGWSLALFPPDGNPRKKLLDDIVPDRPVYLVGVDGHSSWVNSAALKEAGISASTPNPPLGVIEREADGEPTGTLRESAAELVSKLVPPVDPAIAADALHHAIEEANGFGITSLIEASAGKRELDAYKALADAKRLNVRVLISIVHDPASTETDSEFEQLIATREQYRSARVQPDAVKIFVDGVLEGETAALLEPYLDRPGYLGPLNYEPGPLAELVKRIDGMGMQVHMHAIGDRAVRVGLDAIAAARAADGPGQWTHHIAHLQLIDPADLPRFKELNVAANFQSVWAYPDAYITDLNKPVVGEDRVNRMYPIGSALRAGAMIVGGSDWNVSSLNPLDAIQVAVTRKDPDGKIPLVLNANEAVDLPTMLAAYTINVARLMRQDTNTGSIETGKAADLIVVDRNLLTLPPDQIRTARVQRTLLEGETVYRAP